VDARFSPAQVPRDRFVLYAGDAGPRKGLATLRSGLPEGVELKVAGPGHGYVSDDELLALYRAAAVMVLPSLYEGFGFPLVEAMACGTPCIASDDPALVEVSGGAALHFPRGDPGALRLLLWRVLDDASLRDELSRRGIQRAPAFRRETSAALHVQGYRGAG